MAQIILDSNNNLIQGDFDNATLNNRTKLQTTTTNATTNVYVVPNGSSTSAGVSVANNSSLTNASKIVMATNGTTDTQIISGVNGSGSYLPLSFYTNNTFAAQIDTGGRLGINASQPSNYGGAKTVICAGTNPTSGLDTNNQLKIGEATQNFNYCLNVGYINASGTLCGSIQSINNAVATQLLLNPDGGPVLVGTTSPIIDELLGVNQATASRTAILAKAATTGTAAIRTVKVTNVNNSTQLHLAFAYNNGNNGNGAIAGNGDSQAAFATFSDSRLKKNIEDLPSQLDKINALRPVEFDYIKSGEHQIGFIAQEVREVYPDLVAAGEDEMLTVIGLGKTEARLIKAIQEQQTIINELKTRIEALESK